MSEAESSPTEGDVRSPIVDLRQWPIDDVLGDHSALANSMRRVVDDMAQSGESYAAHGSTT